MKAGGVLQEIGLEAMCLRLGTLEATGLLLLHFNGPVGKIWFDAGLVIAAEFEGRRDHDAVIFMSGRREGYLLFGPGEAATDRRMLAQVSTLIQDLRGSRPGSAPRMGSDSSIRPPG